MDMNTTTQLHGDTSLPHMFLGIAPCLLRVMMEVDIRTIMPAHTAIIRRLYSSNATLFFWFDSSSSSSSWPLLPDFLVDHKGVLPLLLAISSAFFAWILSLAALVAHLVVLLPPAMPLSPV